ncbi:MAG: adenine deaminase [Planctomycetaceae bacterium]
MQFPAPGTRTQRWTLSGNLCDPVARRIRPATVTVSNGRIAALTWDSIEHDVWIMPGFVDSHVHVESSLLPPCEFARLAVAHGTVATVSDPHEIGNVLGIAGVEWMLDQAKRSPFKFCFGAPSCVPATAFDRAGAAIDSAGVAALLDRRDVGYHSEMMNYPGVEAGDPGVLAKIAAAKARGKPVDGHAPQLRGADLAAYVAAGITTDHECVSLAEALEKLDLGMTIQIREGSAARNFDALAGLIDSHPDRCMFCSDDKHPDTLVTGHIDVLVRRALARGSDLFDVLQAACVNAVRHYRLPVGLLQLGDPADFIVVDDLKTLGIRAVVVDGDVAALDGTCHWPRVECDTPNTFAARPTSPADFEIRVAAADRARPVRVIEALDGQIVTGATTGRPRIEGDRILPDPAADLLLIAVVDRYADRPPALGLVRNFGLARGAIASSVAHDSHNIVAVGASTAEVARAVNLVIEARGGLAAVGDGRELLLPLPIAGLMSDRPGAEVAARYVELDRFAKDLGSRLGAPFMTLAFMALLVIPALKLGPDGLFDVRTFRPIGLFAD